MQKYIEYLKEIIRKIQDFLAGKTGKARAEGQAELQEVIKLRDMFESAVKKAVENTKAAQGKWTDTISTKNLEIKTSGEYNGNINHSLKWRTDLNRTQFKQVEKWISQAGNPETTRITDTANWYKGRIDGENLFVIYSTENINNPTVLYEVKGVNAIPELNILKKALEVLESERSADEKSRIIDELLVGNWVQEKHDLANNNDRLGERGSNTGYASVLQGESSEFIGSKAFRNVIRNIFEIQAKSGKSNANISYSLKGTNNISTKDQKELLDIIEHLKGEFVVTKFAKADPKKLAKMTKDLLKEYSSKADYDETYKAIDELYQYMANGDDGNTAVWDEVYNRAYNVAQNIIENSLVVDDELYQHYKSLRYYLRSTPMKFNSQYDSVPSSYENFNEFRKMNMGRLKFANNGRGIDSVYQELAGLYIKEQR